MVWWVIALGRALLEAVVGKVYSAGVKRQSATEEDSSRLVEGQEKPNAEADRERRRSGRCP